MTEVLDDEMTADYHCPSCGIDMRKDQHGFFLLHWIDCSLTDDEVYALQEKITEVVTEHD